MCSHILCEEELSVFDPKMNAETLSNHLQSLRQLYKDLRQEQVNTLSLALPKSHSVIIIRYMYCSAMSVNQCECHVHVIPPFCHTSTCF